MKTFNNTSYFKQLLSDDSQPLTMVREFCQSLVVEQDRVEDVQEKLEGVLV